MTTEKKLMYGLDPSKYPARLGQPWKDDEVLKLLTSIQKKKSIEDIAKEHDRTVSGIRAYLKKLATDYHFNDKRPIEEIQKFTGLNKEEIMEAIKKQDYKDSIKKLDSVYKKNNKNNVSPTENGESNMKEVLSLLKSIQLSLNILLEKVA